MRHIETTKALSIPEYTTVNGDTMVTTTIKLHSDTKTELDNFREYKNESYDEVIKKLAYIARMCKTRPELSRETIDAIEKARARMKQGRFLTEDQTRKRLGI